MIRSFVSLMGLAVACVGIGVFIALGVWVWWLKAEVNRQTDALAGRANKALDSADHALGFVRDVIDRAEADLMVARQEALVQKAPAPVNPLLRMTVRTASQNLVGSVDRAHNAVITASEAVVVADAALDVIGGVPEFKQLFRVGPEQVEATRTALGNVSTELQQARGVLGPMGPGAPTEEQLHAVDDALRQATGFTDEVGKVVTSARTKVNDTKQTVDTWSLRVAVATTALSILAAVGQLFMFRYFWRTLRQK